MLAQIKAEARAELGLPDDAKLFVWVEAGETYDAKWLHHSVRSVGVQAAADGDYAGVPNVSVTFPTAPIIGTDVTIRYQLWRMEVRIEGNPVYIEQRWSPETGITRHLRNVHARRNMADIVAALDAEELLGVAGIGREPDVLGLYAETATKWHEVRRTLAGKEPSDQAVGRALHLPSEHDRRSREQVQGQGNGVAPIQLPATQSAQLTSVGAVRPTLVVLNCVGKPPKPPLKSKGSDDFSGGPLWWVIATPRSKRRRNSFR